MMDDFSWDDVPLFLTIVRAGSFARTALKLSISQPSVGRRIDQLEIRLGTKLFERKSTGVELTQAGQTILPIAEKMEKTAKQLAASAISQQCEVEGPISITMPDGLASYWVVPALGRFQDQNPKIRLKLDCGMWQKDMETLNTDFAIMYEEPKDQDTVRVPLCWMHYSYFASQCYVDKFGMPAKIGDLLSHRTIHHVAQNKQKKNWDQNSLALETLSNSEFVTDSSAACIMAVRNGAGILAAPTAICEMFPELVPLPIGNIVTLRLYLYFRRESADVARLQVAKNWLLKLFDPKRTIWFREEFIDPFEYKTKKGQTPNIEPKVA